MRAAAFRGGDPVVDTTPDPVPAEGQVLVRTRACGIRGPDLRAAKFTESFADVARRSGGRYAMEPGRDVAFGHEFVAEVVRNGPGTQGRFRPGGPVASVPLAIAGAAVHGIGHNPEVAGGSAECMPLAERCRSRRRRAWTPTTPRRSSRWPSARTPPPRPAPRRRTSPSSSAAARSGSRWPRR